jgi:hypothetical protein
MATRDEPDNLEHLDPRLVELLDQLRATPPRNPEAEAGSRARFLAELESLALPIPSESPWSRLTRRLDNWRNDHHEMEEIEMSFPKARLAFTAIAVIIIVFVFLSSGSALTVLAAQSALPGDALYPVKTTLEQTRLSLAQGGANRAQLQLEFAERRLGEIEGLIAEGRYHNISAATLEFETYIKNAIAELDTVSRADPARAASLMLQISETLSRYAVTLGSMLSSVPEPVRAEMQHAIQTIQSVSGQDENANGNGNENANTNDNINANENVNANENANTNDNINANENVNANENANTNDNINANGNVNANENTNGNENANINENVNENANANDNNNINDNSANDNGDSGAGNNDNGNDNINQSVGGNDNGNNNNGNDNGNDNDN